jgi:hypothetical protein
MVTQQRLDCLGHTLLSANGLLHALNLSRMIERDRAVLFQASKFTHERFKRPARVAVVHGGTIAQENRNGI